MNINLLKSLSEADSPPGFEDEVRKIILEEIKGYVDKIVQDRFGNLIVEKGDGDFTVVLSAHMDEVGFIVTRIEENGFLRFFPLGGIDARVAYGQQVRLLGEKGKVRGFIGAKAPHLTQPEEKEKVPGYEGMYIDIGAESAEEVRAMGIGPGTPAVFDTYFSRAGNRVLGKAFDDRVGVFVLLNVLKEFDGNVRVVGLFSAQEEVGLRGARVYSTIAEADFALALECTAAADTPDAPQHLQSTRLGKGPAITVADRSLVAHPKVVKLLIKSTESAGIPYQFKEVVAGGTDAGVLQFSKMGIKAGVVSVPARYIHGPLAVADIRDIESAIKLVKAFLATISQSKIK